MNILLLAIILLYETGLSIVSAIEMRNQDKTEMTEAMKVKNYKSTILYSWIPVIIIFIFISFTSTSLADIGFVNVSLNKPIWLSIVILSIATIYVLVVIYQSVRSSISQSFREKVKEKITKQLTGDEHYKEVVLNVLMPWTKKEKRWFFLVSLTAGFCEEIVFRSCMIYLLQSVFPVLSFFVAGLIACVLFCLAHSYQGVKGIITTGLVGFVMFLIYYFTQSVFIAMFVHFVVDFSNAFILFEADKKTDSSKITPVS